MKIRGEGFPSPILDIAEIEKQAKCLPYTITPIGGQEALKEWKVGQAKAEALWQSEKADREATRRFKAISYVQNQDADISLNELDKAEVAFLTYAKKVRPASDWDALLAEHNIEKPLKTKLKDLVLRLFGAVFEK